MSIAVALFTGCNNATKPADDQVRTQNADSTEMSAPIHDKTLEKLALASNEDVVCGMPIKAGLSDTAMVNGKIYGFCSKECKEAYVKDPASFPVKQ